MDPLKKRQDELSELTQMLDDQPIGPEHAFFFPFHEAAGDVRGADPVRHLASAVAMRRKAQSCQLFSGFWGSGKSTELRRLSVELTRRGHTVLLVAAGRVLNLHKAPEVGDLLVSVAAGVTRELLANGHDSPAKRSIAELFKGFLSRLRLKEIKVGAGAGGDEDPVRLVADISFELAKDESFKTSVQAALRGQLSLVTEEFRKLMAEARRILDVRPSQPAPVLIVDDLEKLQGSGPEEQAVQKGIEQIFWSFHEYLRVDGWHLIWAVPPYLQILNAKIPQQYDGSVVLPMVRLWRNDPGRTRDPDGVAAMRACLQKRGPVGSLFESEELLDELIVASSGHLRDLLKLTQKAALEAYTQDDPREPLDRRAVDRIVDDHITLLQNGMFKSDDVWLREIAENRRLRPDTPLEVPRLARLLDTAVVMSYRNGEQWLDVCYAARELIRGLGD